MSQLHIQLLLCTIANTTPATVFGISTDGLLLMSFGWRSKTLRFALRLGLLDGVGRHKSINLFNEIPDYNRLQAITCAFAESTILSVLLMKKLLLFRVVSG